MWNGTEIKIQYILIRHGKTKANEEHRYLGKTEEKLSEVGKKELLQRKKERLYPPCEFLFASPMKRCLETAELLYPKQQWMIIPEWEEMDFGRFEGKNYLDLEGNSDYQAWIDSNGTLPFPEGESQAQFIKRCQNGWTRMEECLFQSLKKRKPEVEEQKKVYRVALVVHGGTIMALLSTFFGGEYFDYQIANGAGYCCIQSVTEQKRIMVGVQKLQQEFDKS